MGRYDYVNRKAARPAAMREAKNKVPLFLAPRCSSDTLGSPGASCHRRRSSRRWIMHDFLPSAVAVAANHPRHRHFRRALFNNRDAISLVLERRRCCGWEAYVSRVVYSNIICRQDPNCRIERIWKESFHF